MIRSCLFIIAMASPALAAAPGRPNVLFIAVDDLRPELNCYGVKAIHSPNIDALAAAGTKFARAYCQQATCNPSRVAVLTGRRPESTGVLDLPTFFRTKVPDAVTLPEHFKANGYYTQRFGKIFHTGQGNTDDARSWSEAANGYQPRRPARPKAAPPKGRAGRAAFAAPDAPDDGLPDGQVADAAIETLKRVKDKPFFLAVGFYKPHLPFVAPKKYWDLYDPAKLELARDQAAPEGAPAYASNDAGELRTYDGIPKKGPLPPELQRELKHGYYACVSYTDAQVGRVLAALDESGLRDRTVVVLWGDHGWQLGEHGTWAKHTDWETATRAPLILAAPGKKPGQTSSALVEFVDIYPTLAELCGLPPVAGLEGVSLVPLLDDPNRTWKSAAFSVWPKRIPGQGPGLGRAIRTDRYRLVEWRSGNREPAAYELYDHRTDPGETVNLANRTEMKPVVAELAAQLRAGWKAARPK